MTIEDKTKTAETTEKPDQRIWVKEFSLFHDVPFWIDQFVEKKIAVDASWHHDTCPTFEFAGNNRAAEGKTLVLAVEHVNQKERDEPERARYTIFWRDAQGNTDQDHFESESAVKTLEQLEIYGIELLSAIQYDRALAETLDYATRKYCTAFLEHFIERWLKDYAPTEPMLEELAWFKNRYGFREETAEGLYGALI